MVRLPRTLLGPAAAGAEVLARLSGRSGMLTRGKIAELFHDDWVASPEGQETLTWRPTTSFAEGFAATLSSLRSTPLAQTSG